MENNNLKELKSLIQVKENILKKIKAFFEKLFINKTKIDISQIKTFEEQYLSKEELQERKIKKENEEKEAKYYQELFENLDNFAVNENLEEDFIEEYEENESKEERKILSKEQFFKVYENIKNGTGNIEKLAIMDLLKMEALLREEISIKNKI